MRDSENMKFSTFDHDNDKDDDANCADWDESGWWFNSCYTCSLNAPYGQLLRRWDNDDILLKEVKMLIRPKEEMKK
ncbi:fibrinogen-like protein 1 [Drosophila sulfurigaster albostrigata]|uniref:fibrinogen-like protein 1 n=1 Tax=Drosophila sulfurigaster albostrigata TaxID=89887 RepID=UPI002D21DE63|nr:fibrinogen-like protein 1 [Drosophila sulfurigaster albostrigata]